MPFYCFTDDTGTTHDRYFGRDDIPESIRLEDGRVAIRDRRAERVGVPAAKGWPLECVASGVNASQAGELREHLRRAGVPTEVSRDGNPIYTSAQHRRRALKARGFYDRNSY